MAAHLGESDAPSSPAVGVPLWRLAAAMAVVTVAPVVALVTTGRFRERLPDPLPTHWGWSGPPDGFTGYPTFSSGLFLVTSLAALGAALVAVIPGLASTVRRVAMAVAGAIAWATVGLWFGIAVSAWDATDAHAVSLTGWFLVWFLGLGLAGGVAAFLVVGPAPVPAPAPVRPGVATADRPVAVLADGEPVVWTRRLTSVLLAVAGGVPLVAAVALVAFDAPIALVVLLALIGVIGTGLGAARLTIDRRGFTVALGWFGIPIKRIPIDQVVGASVAEIRPREWGGWGYRVLPGRSALVIRGGPGMVVDLVDGRRFAVTLDDPAEPVAILNGLAQRQPAGIDPAGPD